jgi:hypothetical protein
MCSDSKLSGNVVGTDSAIVSSPFICASCVDRKIDKCPLEDYEKSRRPSASVFAGELS